MADSIIAFVFVLMTLIGGVLALYFRSRIAKSWIDAAEKDQAEGSIDGFKGDRISATDSRSEAGFWGDVAGGGKGRGDVSAFGSGDTVAGDGGSGTSAGSGDSGD